MGKAIDAEDYRAAKAQMERCPDPDCRNHTKEPDDQPCAPCKTARKTVRDYERVRGMGF